MVCEIFSRLKDWSHVVTMHLGALFEIRKVGIWITFERSAWDDKFPFREVWIGQK